MANDETSAREGAFGLRHSSLIRHWSFEIRHSSPRLIYELAARNGAPIFFTAHRRRFALGGLHRFLDLSRNFGAPLLERLGVQPAVFQDQLFRDRDTILRPALPFDFRRDIT